MSKLHRLAVFVFLAPIFAALLYTIYYRESRETLMERLVDSGVIAMFDGGLVTRDDLQNYFLYPPVEDNTIMHAFELTPEDVRDIGLHEKDEELFKEQSGQLLLNQVIKHLTLIKFLVPQFIPADDPDLEKVVKNYREGLMREAMEKDLAKLSPIVSQEEMLAYYVEHPDEFHQEGKRYARHIMLYKTDHPYEGSSPSSIAPDEVWNRLQNGEDFYSLLVETRSENTTQQGILGWLTRGSLHPKFEQALWAMNVGEVTGPIELETTIHFIQLLDEQPEGLIPFEDCKAKIRNIIRENKRTLHRYKLLGLDPDQFTGGPGELNAEYQKALLEAAYAREWDKNLDIVHKTESYSNYRKADLLFQKQMEMLNKSQSSLRNLDTSWVLESKTATELLKRIGFRLMIKLDLPKFNPQDHDSPVDE